MVGYVGRRGSYRFIYQKCLDTYVDVADSYIKTMVGYVGERGRRVWESYKCGSDLPHNWFSLTPFPRVWSPAEQKSYKNHMKFI